MKKPRPSKHIGRKRRAAGWTLLVLGVLVAGVWAVSGWVSLRYLTPTWSLSLWRGTASLTRYESPIPPGVPGYVSGWSSDTSTTGSRFWGWSWFPIFDEGRGVAYFTPAGTGLLTQFVRFWPLLLLLWTPAALLLRSGVLARRRARKGACPKCGYSLAGLAEGAACPECGKGAATT
ncbi:MAG: hypothetical protein QM783_02885 [Phycisphaerales bacterium]